MSPGSSQDSWLVSLFERVECGAHLIEIHPAGGESEIAKDCSMKMSYSVFCCPANTSVTLLLKLPIMPHPYNTCNPFTGVEKNMRNILVGRYMGSALALFQIFPDIKH